MPKPKYKISEYLLSSLKSKLEEKLSFRIFSKLDCKKISELIEEKSEETISESTLYRLFIWGENKNSPYIHTLDVLAQFIDYKDWFSLEKNLNHMGEFQSLYSGIFNSQEYKSLLNFNIHNNSLKPLYNFLDQFTSDLAFDKKVILGKDIYNSLRTNPNDNIEFFKQFHSLPIIRQGFFEILADPEFSILNYEVGLKFYLKNLKPHESSKALQDYIFAQTILLRHYFLKGEKEQVITIGKSLYLELAATKEDLFDVYIFPKMRYFCYRLFFNEVDSEFNSDYFDWLMDYIHKELAISDNIESRIIIHTICDTLQIYPTLQGKIFDLLHLRYPLVFSKLPSYIFKLPVNKRLRFLDQNASTFFGAVDL